MGGETRNLAEALGRIPKGEATKLLGWELENPRVSTTIDHKFLMG